MSRLRSSPVVELLCPCAIAVPSIDAFTAATPTHPQPGRRNSRALTVHFPFREREVIEVIGACIVTIAATAVLDVRHSAPPLVSGLLAALSLVVFDSANARAFVSANRP